MRDPKKTLIANIRRLIYTQYYYPHKDTPTTVNEIANDVQSRLLSSMSVMAREDVITCVLVALCFLRDLHYVHITRFPLSISKGGPDKWLDCPDFEIRIMWEKGKIYYER